MPDWFAPLVTAIIGAIVMLVIAYAKGIKDLIDTYFTVRKQRLLRSSTSTGLKDIAEFNDIIERLKTIKVVDRILLFTGQNGGGLPKAGKKYTVRSERGWSSINPDVVKMYNFDLVVDSHYADMLNRMVEDGKIHNTAHLLPQDCILRSFYMEEGVKSSLLYFLHCDGSQLTYLSIASYKEEKFPPDAEIKLDIQVERLRSLMLKGDM